MVNANKIFSFAIPAGLECFYTALSDDAEANLVAGGSELRMIDQAWPSPRAFYEALAVILTLFVAYFSGMISGNTLSILAVAVSFTWYHIALALRMCFFPLSFRGFRIFGLSIGWQGIIPSKARKMATKSCDLIIDRLIHVDKILDKLNGELLAARLRQSGIMSRVESAIITSLQKGTFSNVPSSVTAIVLRKPETISGRVTTRFVSEVVSLLKNRNVFNVANLIIDEFSRRKDVLVELFTKVGGKELLVIERSGILMGLVCGLAQSILYSSVAGFLTTTDSFVLFSLTGLIVGLGTNWLALYFIFNPIEPRVLFGSAKKPRVTLHSLFLRRKEEVSRVYAKIVTDTVLNVPRVISHLQSRRKWGLIVDCFHAIFKEEIRNRISSTIPFLTEPQLEKFSGRIFEDVLPILESNGEEFERVLVPFVEEQFQLENQLYVALTNLSYREFDGILHPVFQEDESTLIILGGVLGALVGLLQVYLFHL